MKGPVGLLIVIVVALFGLNLVAFTIGEWEQGVVTQFGEPVRVVREPGLYFKLPNPVQKVTFFDKWLLGYDANPRGDLHQGQEDSHPGQLRQVANRRSATVHADLANYGGRTVPSG